MKIDYIVGQLNGPKAWTELGNHLGGYNLYVVDNLLRHLRLLNTKSYIVESRYIDRDYSSDYLQFYAQTFRTHDRHCQRVHFFSDDIAGVLEQSAWDQRTLHVEEFAERSYCGFCVIRPLSSAPIGRTVLKARVRDYFDMEATVTCRADFEANLFGADLKVTGTSFLQQDSRVGACAQVAIWAGIRHMHARHKYNWISVADITRLAGPTTSPEVVSLPAGSEFLTSERMLRAINESGFSTSLS